LQLNNKRTFKNEDYYLTLRTIKSYKNGRILWYAKWNMTCLPLKRNAIAATGWCMMVICWYAPDATTFSAPVVLILPFPRVAVSLVQVAVGALAPEDSA
jgi:hypothetical protein